MQPTDSTNLREPLKTLFAIIVKAAEAGDRCPSNSPPTYELRNLFCAESQAAFPKRGLMELAAAGFLKIEIAGHNWRTIEILQGPSKGKRTKESAHLGGRTRIIDSKGDRWVGVSKELQHKQRVSSRTQDSSQTADVSADERAIKEPWKPGAPKPSTRT